MDSGNLCGDIFMSEKSKVELNETPTSDNGSSSRIDIVKEGGNPKDSTHTPVASSSDINWKQSKPIS